MSYNSIFTIFCIENFQQHFKKEYKMQTMLKMMSQLLFVFRNENFRIGIIFYM